MIVGVEADGFPAATGEHRERRRRRSGPTAVDAGRDRRAVGRDVDRARERVGATRARRRCAPEADAYLAVDRDRQAEARLVVGVVADEVDPARSPHERHRARRTQRTPRVQSNLLRGGTLGRRKRPEEDQWADACRTRSSWPRASWGVLRDDRKLMVLPLLSRPGDARGRARVLRARRADRRQRRGDSSKPIAWVLGAIGYLAITYVLVFFNAALVWAADKRLRGETVTIGEAVHAAGARAHVLLPWAVLSATVSIVLRAIEERAGIIGRIVGSLIGLAWSLVTFLVLPVLVDRAGRADPGGQALGRAVQAHVGREHDGQRRHRDRGAGRHPGRRDPVHVC